MNSISSCSVSPRGWGGAESSNPLVTSPISWSHPININSDVVERGLLCKTKDAPLTFITQEIPRVLEALCQEPKPNICIFLMLQHYNQTQALSFWDHIISVVF